jgi:hypothetical protein
MKRLGKYILAFVMVGVSMAPALAQPFVDGLPGRLTLTANPQTNLSVLVVLSAALPGDSGQLVLVLQHEPQSPLPSDWSGPGRLLTAPGSVTVVGDDGTPVLHFGFADRQMPTSVRPFTPRGFAIVGIARYGEQTPLSAEQIDALRRTGSCAAADVVGPRSADSCTDCTSGGPGATSCGGGGGTCSVSCASGWFACCNASVNHCYCCRDQ